MHFLILDSVKLSFCKRETYGYKPVPCIHCLLSKTLVTGTKLKALNIFLCWCWMALRSWFKNKKLRISFFSVFPELISESESRSVVSHSLQPNGLYSPWNSPCHNTAVGSLSLLQRIFATQGLNPGLLHCRRILYQLSHKGSPWNLKDLSKSRDQMYQCVVLRKAPTHDSVPVSPPPHPPLSPPLPHLPKGGAEKEHPPPPAPRSSSRFLVGVTWLTLCQSFLISKLEIMISPNRVEK